MVETFFKAVKFELIWPSHRTPASKPKTPSQTHRPVLSITYTIFLAWLSKLHYVRAKRRDSELLPFTRVKAGPVQLSPLVHPATKRCDARR